MEKKFFIRKFLIYEWLQRFLEIEVILILQYDNLWD